MDSPATSPRPVFAAYLHQFVTYGLLQAIRLELFPTLDRLGQASAATLAGAMGVTPGMLANLLDLLTVSGLLEKVGARTPPEYRLQPPARAYLGRRDSAWDLSGFNLLQGETWDSLMAQGDTVLRSGAPARRGAPTSRERWAAVVSTIAPLALQQAPLLIERLARAQGPAGPADSPYELLDAGCGVGRLSAQILRALPAVHSTGADFPVVLELATQELQSAGLRARFTPLAVDLTREVPLGPRGPYAGCIAAMFCQVLDESQLHSFFHLAGQAMQPGGSIWILDCLPDDERQAADRWIEIVFSYMMSFIGGRAYTAGDYRRLLEATGWAEVEIIRTDGVVSVVQAHRI
ncbi:MAG TPA: class I SAM-dependent methyltransferase [Chloroflexia bacterium]|nr:class I SAM-dependent methyltransferase [Chloroflexia bacterium]